MKTYLTEWKQNGHTYGGEIEAFNWYEAQKIADFNGRDEKVIGEKIEEIVMNENNFLPFDKMPKKGE